MSILFDLLSKVKTAEPRRDVPPGLRSMISGVKKQEFNRRRFMILMIFAASAFGLGSGVVYFLSYTTALKRQPVTIASKARSIETKTETVKTSEPQKSEQVVVPSPQKEETEPKQLLEQRPHKKEIPEPSVKKDITQKKPAPAEKKASGQAAAAAATPKMQDVDVKQEIKEKTESVAAAKQNVIYYAQKTENLEQQNTGLKEMYLYMAENQERKGDFSSAITSYKKVLEIEQGNYRVMNKISQILIRMNMHDAAMKYLQDALRLKPDYVPALINAGIAYANGGNNAEAEKSFLKALSLEETNHYALLNIAILYENQKKYDSARNYYLKLQRLGNAQGSAGLERIEALLR